MFWSPRLRWANHTRYIIRIVRETATEIRSCAKCTTNFSLTENNVYIKGARKMLRNLILTTIVYSYFGTRTAICPCLLSGSLRKTSMSCVRRIWDFKFSTWNWKRKSVITDETTTNIKDRHEDETRANGVLLERQAKKPRTRGYTYTKETGNPVAPTNVETGRSNTWITHLHSSLPTFKKMYYT